MAGRCCCCCTAIMIWKDPRPSSSHGSCIIKHVITYVIAVLLYRLRVHFKHMYRLFHVLVVLHCCSTNCRISTLVQECLESAQFACMWGPKFIFNVKNINCLNRCSTAQPHLPRQQLPQHHTKGVHVSCSSSSGRTESEWQPEYQ
jgi:hypothetical protein